MDALFDSKYVSKEVQKSLKEGFIVRPLASSDYEKGNIHPAINYQGFLEVLGMLTSVGKMPKKDFLERFNYLKKHNHEYFTIVIEDIKAKKIVGAGTIFVERKFVHHNGLVGHIEDIVTHSDYRGFKLGKMVIETLKHIGDLTGCYKIILDCSDKNIPFYVKCGFAQKEFEMAYYIKQNDVPNAKAKL